MKKYLLSFLLLAFAASSLNAQIVRGDMNGDGKVDVSDVTMIVSVILGNSPITYITEADIVKYEYVDLGLPSGTLWATCNIGAKNPEDYGDYFAWGETEPQEGNTYSWVSYKYAVDNYDNLTKYCNDSSFGNNGFTDNLTELELADDAAFMNKGTGWRMPSKEQFDELVNSEYTTSEWITQNSVKGRKITSLSNGNSIFLPAAGYRYDRALRGTGSSGYYWSRTLYSDGPIVAWSLRVESSGASANIDLRCNGCSIRPVRLSK